MLDLLGMEIPDPVMKVVFSEAEVDSLYVNIISEGELLNDLGANLEKLKDMKGDLRINTVRKNVWNDLIWVYELDEPSPVPFDLACEVCGADAEGIRSAISQEFGDEIRLMYKVICAQIPGSAEKFTMRLRRYARIEKIEH